MPTLYSTLLTSRGETKSHTPTSYILIEGVTLSDTLNHMLRLKAIIQIKPIEWVTYANQSGRDFKSHSDFATRPFNSFMSIAEMLLSEFYPGGVFSQTLSKMKL